MKIQSFYLKLWKSVKIKIIVKPQEIDSRGKPTEIHFFKVTWYGMYCSIVQRLLSNSIACESNILLKWCIDDECKKFFYKIFYSWGVKNQCKINFMFNADPVRPTMHWFYILQKCELMSILQAGHLYICKSCYVAC